MRYQLVGKKTECVGKTLWEILGNLKNFGVGRMIVRSTLLKFQEPSFWRIVKVQPLPPPRKEFQDRDVMVWVEEVFKGRKVPDVVMKNNNKMADYILVPKNEEAKYLKLAETYKGKDTREVIPKYINFPPLFKQIWEAEFLRQHKKPMAISMLKTYLKDDIYSDFRLGEKDEVMPKLSSQLHIQNVPVEDLIKEIVRLQKIVNANS